MSKMRCRENVLVQRAHTNLLRAGHMKCSWIWGVIKRIELGLVRCPKYSTRSETKGDIEEEKRVSKRKIVTLAWRQNSASILDDKPTFSPSYVRESLVFVFRGQAWGKTQDTACILSGPSDGGSGPCSKLISSATFSLLFRLKFGMQARSFHAWVCVT